MTEYERILAFLRRLEDGSAERLEPTTFGPVLIHERLDRVHDLNFLRADSPEDASAQELAAETERVQGPLGLRHRRVTVMERAESERLTPGFSELGWRRTSFLVMAHRARPERSRDVSVVREVEPEALRELWADGIRSQPFAGDEEVVQQLVAAKDVVASAVPTRYYAAEADGRLAACCEFYSEDGVGQVEAVMTLEPFRNRGLASALVLTGLEQSRSDGNELTFLTALEHDWPKELYAKLGFAVVGGYDDFLKSPA
jgi:ribosomal protein S18 acetylase RimI-like enzyme